MLVSSGFLQNIAESVGKALVNLLYGSILKDKLINLDSQINPNKTKIN